MGWNNSNNLRSKSNTHVTSPVHIHENKLGIPFKELKSPEVHLSPGKI